MRIQKIQKSDISFSESSTDLFCFGHTENSDLHETLSAASEHFSNNIQKAIELENFSGKLYNPVFYGVDKVTGMLDYDEIERIAKKEQPKMIIAGASAYSRDIDFKRFKKIKIILISFFIYQN